MKGCHTYPNQQPCVESLSLLLYETLKTQKATPPPTHTHIYTPLECQNGFIWRKGWEVGPHQQISGLYLVSGKFSCIGEHWGNYLMLLLGNFVLIPVLAKFHPFLRMELKVIFGLGPQIYTFRSPLDPYEAYSFIWKYGKQGAKLWYKYDSHACMHVHTKSSVSIWLFLQLYRL